MENSSVHDKIVAYRRIAEESQAAIIEWLRTIPDDALIRRSFWVFNGIHIEVTTGVILELAKRTDVGWISHDGEVRIIAEPSAEAALSTRAIEWNIQKIMADSCWTAGFTGQGVILGETDTGVDYTHPALQDKWAGYWYDAINGQSTPYDDHNHGTHCMGTIMGGDGFGSFVDDIGVAPGATFVAAKVLNSGGSGTYAQCAAGLQFMADIKDSVDVKAVSNSWCGSNAADSFFYPVARTYKSLGILPVFANGNSGPNPGTVGCPGANSNVIGVGATDNTDAIANFSSRGPAPDQAPFNDPTTWFRDDWNLIKPQISAPGVNVRSCIPGGTYASWNGTSMATPHVTGSVGIICQKNPNLSTTELYSFLLDNVDEPSAGAPYPNNNYGWGRLNVWRSLNGTPSMNQPWISILSKSITDPAPGGNGNGVLEPGETCRMTVDIKNTGGATADNTVGVLKSFDNFITIGTSTYNFGNLPPGGTATNSGTPFTFAIHSLTPQGHVSRIGLILSCDGAYDSLDFCDTVFYNLTIGTAPAPHVIYEDDFEYGSGIDSFLNYWDKTRNWNRATNQYHSPTHSAYSGTANDSVMTLTLKNSINLTQYTSPELKIWHKYRFEQGLFLDSARILVSTNGGTSWAGLWQYNWQNGDTIPWKEEVYPLNSYLSNNVKIRFAVDAYTFFNDYADWWIDDFKITVPSDNEPPYFTNTTVWHDTSFSGPFPVQSIVTDRSGVDSVRLHYRINSGSWQQLAMTLQGGSLYQATIPSQPLNTQIDYYLWAKDRWVTPNSGCDPVGAPSGSAYYSFRVRPIGVGEERSAIVCFACAFGNPVRERAGVNFGISGDTRIRITIYDLAGRSVRTLVDAHMKAGAYEIAWNLKDDTGRSAAAGVYFLDFRCGRNDEFQRIEKLVLVK
jgi:subtilisin family serine protease